MIALVLGLATTSCATMSRKPLVSPANGGAKWTEITSAHFVLNTDFEPDDAMRASAKLEASYSALSDLGFASTEPPKLRIDIVLFKHPEDYHELALKMSAGSFYRLGLNDLEHRPFGILYGDLVESTVAVFQHELTHLFVGYYFPQAPIWLNEGLAQYFETLVLEDGTATLGREVKGARFWKGPWRFTRGQTGVTSLIPVSEALSVRELRAMHPLEFRAGDFDPNTKEGFEPWKRVLTHYQSAFRLVHFLMTDPNYAPMFNAYLGRIRAGEKDGNAWARTLGAMPADKLDADYRATLVPKEVLLLKTKYAPPAFSVQRERALPDHEVHVLWARIRPWNTPERERAVFADLEAAEKEAPLDPNLALVQGTWLLHLKRYSEARAVFQGAALRTPNDARLWNALGVSIVRDAEADESHRQEAPKQIEEVYAKLQPIAASAAQLDFLALASALRGDLDAGLDYEKRAVRVDPNCVDCLARAGRILHDKHLYAPALDVLSLALALAADGSRTDWVVKLTNDCRRRLAEPDAAKPADAKTP
jgi:tetratricopeptide (TPR) repeat protein